jgi:hypothetical protein
VWPSPFFSWRITAVKVDQEEEVEEEVEVEEESRDIFKFKTKF